MGSLDDGIARDPSKLRAALADDKGISTMGNDPLLQKTALETMGAFIDQKPPVPWHLRTDATLLEMPVREVVRRTLQTAVDILNDISATLTERNVLSGTEFRRKLFGAFTSPDRRLYVGIWLVVLSFVLYFIDSAA